MQFKYLVFLELISGILFALAIPNQYFKFGTFIFGLCALIPHFISMEKSKNLKQTFFLIIIQTLTVHLLSSFWLAYFKDFAIFTLGASALGTVAIHSFFCVLYFLPHLLKQKDLYTEYNSISFFNSNAFKVLWYSAVYTIWEFTKSRGFLGYPWGTLPMTAFDLKILVQIVDITGVRAITFLFSFFATTFAFFTIDLGKFDYKKAFIKNKNIFSALLVFFMISIIYGTFQYTKPRIPIKHLNTILIQQNYDPWNQPNDLENIIASEILTLKGVQDFQEQNKKADLVVWSEGVLSYPFPLGANTFFKSFPEENRLNSNIQPLTPFLANIGAPTIIGAPYCQDFEQDKFSNAAILFGKDGLYQDYYAKIHLVPFAEKIPFADNKFVQMALQKIVGFSSGWVAGTEFKVFPIESSDYPNQNVNISIPICFEDAYADIFAKLKKNGTELFVNITDDSWSMTESSEYQHFVISWYRAIEFRTTMLRSTNSGYTIVEEPSGRILWDLPLFKSTYLSKSIPVYESYLTVYARFGEWFSALFMIFLLVTEIHIIIRLSSKKPPLKKLILKEIYKLTF